MKEIKFELINFLDKNTNNSKDFIKNVLEKIKFKEGIGFAGWTSKEALRKNLEFSIGDLKRFNPEMKITDKDLREHVKKILEKVKNILKEKLFLYVFPTNSDFVKNKLSGVTGYCIFKNVIYIYVYPDKNWKDYFGKTLVHEVAHSVSDYYSSFDNSLGEMIVFDGLAENFVENVFGEPNKDVVNILSKQESLELFEKIKGDLDSKEEKKYHELFFGSGKYPIWTGYSMGYALTKKYLENKKEINWSDLLRKEPKKILSALNL